MKWLKTIFLFLLVLAGALILSSVFSSATVEISKEIVVDEKLETTYRKLSNLKNRSNWDSHLVGKQISKEKVSGLPGKIGNLLEWRTKDDYGSVELTSTNSKDSMVYLEVGEYFGFKTEDVVTFKLYKELDKTRISLNRTSGIGLFKLLNYFRKDEIIEDVKQSLSNAKSWLEKNKVSSDFLDAGEGIKIVSEHGRNYVAMLFERVDSSGFEELSLKAYPAIYKYLQTNGLTTSGHPVSLLYSTSKSGYFKAAAAVPISDKLEASFSKVLLSNDSCYVSDESMFITTKGASREMKRKVLVSYADSMGMAIVLPLVETHIVGRMHTDRPSGFKTRLFLYYNDSK
jgi:hypothetical protein